MSMRFSEFGLTTLKEVPAEAEIVSHQLMLRAGLIRRLASGLFTWMPLGLRVLRKVEQIDLPAGVTTALKPGGLHVMFINLKAPLEADSEVDVKLNFEDGSSRQLTLPVRKKSTPSPCTLPTCRTPRHALRSDSPSRRHWRTTP